MQAEIFGREKKQLWENVNTYSTLELSTPVVLPQLLFQLSTWWCWKQAVPTAKRPEWGIVFPDGTMPAVPGEERKHYFWINSTTSTQRPARPEPYSNTQLPRLKASHLFQLATTLGRTDLLWILQTKEEFWDEFPESKRLPGTPVHTPDHYNLTYPPHPFILHQFWKNTHFFEIRNFPRCLLSLRALCGL